MGREHRREVHARPEQHVADFLDLGIVDLRTIRQATDLLQRPGQPLGLARELNRRGIREELARPRHARLDPAPEEHADVADDHHRECDQENRHRALAVPRMAHAFKDLAPDQSDHEDAEQQAHQSDVQAHVAVQDVTEFVRDHALQFVALELLQRASGDRHRRVGRRVAGGEGVDAGFLFEHVDLGHRHTRRDCDFLDHVAQTTMVRIRGLGRDQRATQRLRDHGAARTQRTDLEQRRQTNDAGHAQTDAKQQIRVLADGLAERESRRGVLLVREQRHDHDQIDRRDDGEHREHEQQHQSLRLSARLVLRFEEVHGGTGRRAARSRRVVGFSRI